MDHPGPTDRTPREHALADALQEALMTLETFVNFELLHLGESEVLRFQRMPPRMSPQRWDDHEHDIARYEMLHNMTNSAIKRIKKTLADEVTS